MPITVSCSCGRRLKAPDKLLGKKAKCPDCGKVLLIVEAEQEPKSDPKPAAATPVRPAGTKTPIASPGGGSSRVIDADDSDGAYGLAGDDDDLMPSEPPAPSPTVTPSTTSDQGPSLADLAMLEGGEDAGSGGTPGLTSGGDEGGDDFGLVEPQEEEPAAGLGAGGLAAALADDDSPSDSGAVSMGAKAIAKRDKARQEHASQGLNLGSIAGVEITIKKIVILLVLIGASIYGTYWWFSPKAELVVVEAVDRLIALDNIFESRGVRTLNPRETAARGSLVLGGNDQAIVTRPNPDGKYVIAIINASQAYLRDHGVSGQHELAFQKELFHLRDDKGKTYPAIMLKKSLQGNVPFGLHNAKTTDYRAMFPKSHQPDGRENVTPGYFGSDGTATLIFNGSKGANGKVTYTSYHHQQGSQSAKGFNAVGRVSIDMGQGKKVEYKYSGSSMQIIPPGDALIWHATDVYEEKDSMVGPIQGFTIIMLFERPPDAKTLSVMIGYKGKEVQVGSSWPNTFTNQTGTEVASRVESQIPVDSEDKGGKDGPLAKGRFSKPMGQLGIPESKRHMGKILVAIKTYRIKHQNNMPKTLDQLFEDQPTARQYLTNPRTGRPIGYVYLNPGKIFDAKQTAILFEADSDGQPDQKGLKGFYGGTVE